MYHASTWRAANWARSPAASSCVLVRSVSRARPCRSACEEQRLIPHSCGLRSCPHCQHHEGEIWLERQRRLQVPAEYFLLTFTLPKELRPLALCAPKVLYTALFASARATVQSFCKNDRKLKGEAGAVAVLHTHSRRQELHPHIHLALARVFRGKLLAALKDAGQVLPNPLLAKWVVDCKSVGDGEKALIYLGRYLYRGVLREDDILSSAGGQVRFRYRDSQGGKMQERSLPGADFLRLLLQHVLPKGFRRARNYGFLHPNKKGLIALLHIVLRVKPRIPLGEAKPRPKFLCPCCGAPMTVKRRRI